MHKNRNINKSVRTTADKGLPWCGLKTQKHFRYGAKNVRTWKHKNMHPNKTENNTLHSCGTRYNGISHKKVRNKPKRHKTNGA